MGLIGKKIPKEGWGSRKKYPRAESRIYVFKSLCMCDREREKIAALVSLQSFLRHQIPYSSAEPLTKTSFFLYFRDHPKMTKEAKER